MRSLKITIAAVFAPADHAHADGDMDAWVTILHAGLPFRALEGHFIGPPTGRNSEYQFALMIPESLRPVGSRMRLFDYLPLRPTFPGFVLNAVIFLGCMLCIHPGLRRARSVLRVRRGRCAKCGYSLQAGAQHKCPECGEPVPRNPQPGHARAP